MLSLTFTSKKLIDMGSRVCVVAKEAAGRSKPSVTGKQWDEKTLETTVAILQEILNEPRPSIRSPVIPKDRNKRAKQDLERRVRSGTGAPCALQVYRSSPEVREFRGKCCGVDEPTPESEQDIAYRLIEDFTKASALRDGAGAIMEWAAEIFGNVKKKAVCGRGVWPMLGRSGWADDGPGDGAAGHARRGQGVPHPPCAEADQQREQRLLCGEQP